MGADDGERIARLEEQVRELRQRVDASDRKVWGAITLGLAFVGNKILALIGQ